MATKSARRATVSTPRRISTASVASKSYATAADSVSPTARPASTRLSRARRDAALENHPTSTTIQNSNNNNKQQIRANRRSSITAMTASVRAKQVKTTNPDDRPKNTNTATRPCNAPEPNKKMITRQRSKSVLVKKESSSDDAGNRSLMEINKRLLAALLCEETPEAETAPSETSKTTKHQGAAQDRENVDIFNDSEDDDIFERNRKAIGDARKPSRSAARRRQSMPPISANERPELSTAEDRELWNELTSLKSRLTKLESNRPAHPDVSEQSSETTSSCMFDAVPGSPSTATSTAESPSSSRFMTVQQRRLLDALALMEQTGIPAAKAMRAVVHEAITTNQVLWSSIPHDLATDARTLIGLQKSSDNQIKELTEALYLMASPPAAKPSSVVYHRRSLDEQPPIQSLYGGYPHRRFSTDRSSVTSGYHLPHLTQHNQHHSSAIHGGRPVSEYYEKPAVPYLPSLPSATAPGAASIPSPSGGTLTSAGTGSPEMVSPRPFKIAGILDYPISSSYSRQTALPATNYHYQPQPRSKNYESPYPRSGGSVYS